MKFLIGNLMTVEQSPINSNNNKTKNNNNNNNYNDNGNYEYEEGEEYEEEITPKPRRTRGGRKYHRNFIENSNILKGRK